MPIAVRTLVLKYLPLALLWALSICIAVAVTWRLACPPRPPPPADAAALAERVKPLGWHAIVVSPAVIYFTTNPELTPQQAYSATRPGHATGAEQGVVLCEHGSDGWQPFGDPAMISKLRELLAH